MHFDDDKVIEVLQRMPAEGPCVDYKVIPYKKTQNHALVQDVIAMLNSEAAAGKDKFIIIGVEDKTKNLVGIDPDEWRDDTEWQDLFAKISPRPDVRTGYVKFESKLFGFFYIPSSNREWVYEALETIVDCPPFKERNMIAKGQAYIRIGSRNEVLMAEGRKRLMQKKSQTSGPFLSVGSYTPIEKKVSLTLAFVGNWCETFEGDREIVERIAGIDYNAFKEGVRDLYEQNQIGVGFLNGRWTLSNHKDYLISMAESIYDDHLDVFFEMLGACFSYGIFQGESTDKEEGRGLLQYYNEQLYYSREVKRGLSETLAILGNNIDSFGKCSRDKIINCIYKFERSFFTAKDWRVYASAAEELSLLGEACPKAFMSEIKRLLTNKDETFIQFLSSFGDSVIPMQYGSQIFYVLANIAKEEKYFSEAMETLLLLAQLRSEVIDIMVEIMIPWYPQTCASPEMRVGFLKGAFNDDRELAWSILMKLMPRATTTINPVQKPTYLNVNDVPESVTQKEYFETSIKYIRMAIEHMGSDVDHMCAMISVFNDVDGELEKEILDSIVKNSENLPENDKAVLWNGLQDFLHKHRKYADADWALDEERLAPVEAIMHQIVKDERGLASVRMFRKDQYSLLDDMEKYDEEEKKLREKQVSVIRCIYETDGMRGIKDFLKKIENTRIAGVVASEVLNNDDIRQFVSESKNITDDAFVDGLVSSNTFERVITQIEGFSDVVKAKVLSKLTLSNKTIDVVTALSEDAQEVFWKEATLWGYLTEDFSKIYEAISNFNKYRRTDKSIVIIYKAISKNADSIAPDIVIDTMLLNVDYHADEGQNDFYVQRIIKWLQSRSIKRKLLLEIEWKYLGLLRNSEGCPPITLWAELSSNPEFFVSMVDILAGKAVNQEWSEEDKKRVYSHCFSLLYDWKRMPGVDESGKVHNDKLESWLSAVKQLSQKDGTENLALDYFGRTTFHSPADEDGFFIDRGVARVLQDDRDGLILSGFVSEAINSRGVHSIDVTGETEFGIEADYVAKARAADERGYFRLATKLRNIAGFYHEEGIRYRNMSLK